MNNELEIQHARIANVQKVKQKLLDVGSVNFNVLMADLQSFELTDTEKSELSDAFIQKVQRMVEQGNFRDLEGAKQMAEKLGIDNVEINTESTSKIDELLAKYSYGFLIAMSPSLFNGKLISGEDYDKIDYVQKLAANKGMNISKEEIEELWQYREILVLLHSKQQRLTAGQNLLELPRLLLHE